MTDEERLNILKNATVLYLSKCRKQKLDNVIGISEKPKLEKEEETEESSEEEEAISTVFNYFKLLSNVF